MTEELQLSAPPRRTFGRRIAAISLVVAGFAGGAIVASGMNPAAGDPPVTDWEALSLETGWDNASTYVPNYDLEYKVDSDGDVHIRGAVVSSGVDVHRYPSDDAGPWVAKIAQLPCGLFPAETTGGTGGVADLEGQSAYHGGFQVMPDGSINLAVWDAPVFEIEGSVKVALVVSGNFSYDPDEDDTGCPETTTTTAPEETTTTVEE